MKEKRRKKQSRRMLSRLSMKIMCRYCKIEEGKCNGRELKEKAEQKGIMTKCIKTPNLGFKAKPWEKINKKGEIINVNKHNIPINRWFFDEPKNYTKKRGCVINATKQTDRQSNPD